VFLVRSVYFNLRNILPKSAHSSRDTLCKCIMLLKQTSIGYLLRLDIVSRMSVTVQIIHLLMAVFILSIEEPQQVTV